jgi:hypothetical protein
MKIRCKLCNTVIKGDKKGHMIYCECRKCAIDETPYYARIIGNFEDYENINDKESKDE